MPTVLIIDDVRPLAEQYAYDLERLGGFQTRVAVEGDEGLAILAREVIDCVILDLEMPGKDGFDVLRSLDHIGSSVPVIVYTGTGSYDRCMEAVRLGAFGFIDKAESMERVLHEVRLALRHASLREQVRELDSRVSLESTLLGNSAVMTSLRDQIAKLASIDSPVLILGESGTGKELVARELHAASSRAESRFVPINCGGLAEGLTESELFGHDKGAFTGAVKARKGAFEAASEGTLFLDEIGELPAAAQAALLRAMESGEVRRVGSDQASHVDTRVVAATHRDLDTEVAEGRFREDLLFRLNVHVVRVPPLRERREDISSLLTHFVQTLSPRLGRTVRPVTDEARRRLAAHDYSRNNVRELRNIVERMIIDADGPVIDETHVPELDSRPAQRDGSAPDDGFPGGRGSFKERRAEAERRIVMDALHASEGQVGKAAADLGLADHASLLKIMRRLGIRRD